MKGLPQDDPQVMAAMDQAPLDLEMWRPRMRGKPRPAPKPCRNPVGL
jgi:hypothetical protein